MDSKEVYEQEKPTTLAEWIDWKVNYADGERNYGTINRDLRFFLDGRIDALKEVLDKMDDFAPEPPNLSPAKGEGEEGAASCDSVPGHLSSTTFHHDSHCNANRRLPVGAEGCSCYVHQIKVTRETITTLRQSLSSAESKIKALQEEIGEYRQMLDIMLDNMIEEGRPFTANEIKELLAKYQPKD